jgi:hypothetical protein
MESKADWYVLKNSEYHCGACGDELTRQTVTPAFTLGAESVAVNYSCQHQGCANFGRQFILSNAA